MQDKLIKIEGENRIIINGVINSIAYLLSTQNSINFTRKELLNKITKALKTNKVIISIYEMILLQENNKKEIKNVRKQWNY